MLDGDHCTVDSAGLGQNSLFLVSERHVREEVSVRLGRKTACILWDIEGYYDFNWYSTIGERDPVPPVQANERQQIPLRGGSYLSAAAFSTITYRGFRLLMRRDRALPEVSFRCLFERP